MLNTKPAERLSKPVHVIRVVSVIVVTQVLCENWNYFMYKTLLHLTELLDFTLCQNIN
jgi:hypothetical protein